MNPAQGKVHRRGRVGERVRVGVLAVLVLLLPVAGCFTTEPEDGPRLAQPTDKPADVPRPTSSVTVADPLKPNYTDEGFVFTQPWRQGDAWDWESSTHWRSLRVVGSSALSGRTLLRIVQANGSFGPGPVTRVEWWVDAGEWTKVNQTSLENGRNLTFEPRAPGLRAFRNASIAYNETGLPKNATVRANVWYKGTEKVQSVWGQVTTGHVEYFMVRSGHEPGLIHLVRHVSREAGNDIAFEENDEKYRLVAFRFGGNERGVLRDI